MQPATPGRPALALLPRRRAARRRLPLAAADREEPLPDRDRHGQQGQVRGLRRRRPRRPPASTRATSGCSRTGTTASAATSSSRSSRRTAHAWPCPSEGDARRGRRALGRGHPARLERDPSGLVGERGLDQARDGRGAAPRPAPPPGRRGSRRGGRSLERLAGSPRPGQRRRRTHEPSLIRPEDGTDKRRLGDNPGRRNEGGTMGAELHETAKALVAEGKGILAADESDGTIKKRFDSIGVESTEDNRRAYRELLFTTPGAEEYISGVILFDETIRQSSSDGTPFPKLLERARDHPGDQGRQGREAARAAPRTRRSPRASTGCASGWPSTTSSARASRSGARPTRSAASVRASTAPGRTRTRSPATPRSRRRPASCRSSSPRC